MKTINDNDLIDEMLFRKDTQFSETPVGEISRQENPLRYGILSCPHQCTQLPPLRLISV